jgi:hypothetical protein
MERTGAAAGPRIVNTNQWCQHLNGAAPENQGRICERCGTEANVREPKCSGDEQSRPGPPRQNKFLLVTSKRREAVM